MAFEIINLLTYLLTVSVKFVRNRCKW